MRERGAEWTLILVFPPAWNMGLDANSLVSNCAFEGNLPIVATCHALIHMVKCSLSERTRFFFQMKLSQ